MTFTHQSFDECAWCGRDIAENGGNCLALDDEECEPIRSKLGEAHGLGVPLKSLEGQEVSPSAIRKRMSLKYGSPYGERELISSYHEDGYCSIQSAYFSLYGSPPKGYAVYTVSGPGSITFFGPHMKPYEKWRDLSLSNID